MKDNIKHAAGKKTIKEDFCWELRGWTTNQGYTWLFLYTRGRVKNPTHVSMMRVIILNLQEVGAMRKDYINQKLQTRIQYTSVPTSRGWTWWYQRRSPTRRVFWAPLLKDWWRPPWSRWCRPPSPEGWRGRGWWHTPEGHSLALPVNINTVMRDPLPNNPLIQIRLIPSIVNIPHNVIKSKTRNGNFV